ncbi:MAG: hypothetical protein ACK42Z_09500, partial [Candidatus Kapaibacteriota bacterium]
EYIDESLENNFEIFQLVVEEIRKLRNEIGIEPNKKLDLVLATQNPELKNMLNANCEALLFLVKGNQIRILDKVEESLNSITSIVRDVEIQVLIGKDIDLTKEIERISKEIERLQNNILVINNKLNNPTFLEKAKPEVIEKEKIKLGSMTETLNKLEVLFTKLKKQ